MHFFLVPFSHTKTEPLVYFLNQGFRFAGDGSRWDHGRQLQDEREVLVTVLTNYASSLNATVDLPGRFSLKRCVGIPTGDARC